MSTKLSLQSVAKAFGTNQVLRDVSLDINTGEVVSFIGASGSGKTTLLRCINLLETLDSGSILLDEKDITAVGLDANPVRRRIGIVFQSFNLFPHMTALGNVMEGLRTVKGMSQDAAQTKALEQLARVGLLDKASDYPARLSGGQKQRVAIARALAMEPELLLFDEPTSALDPELVVEVLRVIRKLAEEGRTMLLVTHEIGFAYHFANRVLFIADGVIHESGTPDEVLKNPRQTRTQAFLARHNEFKF